MPGDVDDLGDLDNGQVPGPAPAIEGLTTPEAPPALEASPAEASEAAEVLEPPAPAAGNGKRRRPSGAEFRRRRLSKGGDAGRSPDAAPPDNRPPFVERPKPAAEEDPAALEEARKRIEDPETLEFIEGLYRLPFELWASAVKVQAVVPRPEKIERAARLIRQSMLLWGPKAWMKYLPLVFLAVALGEDIGHGVQAVKHARKGGSETRTPPRDPIPPAGAPESIPPTLPPAPAPAAAPAFDGPRDVPAAAAARRRIRGRTRRGPRRGPRR